MTIKLQNIDAHQFAAAFNAHLSLDGRLGVLFDADTQSMHGVCFNEGMHVMKAWQTPLQHITTTQLTSKMLLWIYVGRNFTNMLRAIGGALDITFNCTEHAKVKPWQVVTDMIIKSPDVELKFVTSELEQGFGSVSDAKYKVRDLNYVAALCDRKSTAVDIPLTSNHIERLQRLGALQTTGSESKIVTMFVDSRGLCAKSPSFTWVIDPTFGVDMHELSIHIDELSKIDRAAWTSIYAQPHGDNYTLIFVSDYLRIAWSLPEPTQAAEIAEEELNEFSSMLNGL